MFTGSTHDLDILKSYGLGGNLVSSKPTTKPKVGKDPPMAINNELGGPKI
jgi:hypothetical protein